MRRDRALIISSAVAVIAWVLGRRFVQQSAMPQSSAPDYPTFSPTSTSPSADVSSPDASEKAAALVAGDRAAAMQPAAMSGAETALTEQFVVDAPETTDSVAGSLDPIDVNDAVVVDAPSTSDDGETVVVPVEDVPGITTTDLVDELLPNVQVDQAEAAPATLGTTNEETPAATPDDLIVIEGIGPKISAILIGEGVTTFAQLVDADVAQISTILRNAGITTANPSTWAQQAELARDGQWDALKELQGRIKNGRLES